MIVVTVTDCPPRLRGDLSKWLIEISTGVFVGCVSARVREELWKRTKENLSNGRATMVFSTNNEQRLDFHVHNTSWVPVDYDGLKLIRRPLPGRNEAREENLHESNVSAFHKVERISLAKKRMAAKAGYIVMDFETTGLDSEKDEILEIGALRIIEHEIAERLCVLVQTQSIIPKGVQQLTGITPKQQLEQGISLAEALNVLEKFVEGSPIICHNAAFERRFWMEACARMGKTIPKNAFTDTLILSRRYVTDVPDYKLSTLAEYFGLPQKNFHRAETDCEATFLLYEKLNKIR